MAATPSHVYIAKPHSVKQAFETLRSRPVHPHFAAYLAIKRACRSENRPTVNSKAVKEFFDDFLQVRDLPEARPYAMPFDEAGAGGNKDTFNKNVAGSYAPSSLREVAPLKQVVVVAGTGNQAKYTLKPSHAELALSNLLYGQPLQASVISTFLYRDWAFSDARPGAAFLTATFRDEFGFREAEVEESKAFAQLFVSEPDDLLAALDWFEPYGDK